MHASLFDHYHDLSTLIHKADPRVKTLFTFLYILSNALLPDGAWLGFGLAWVIVWGISLTARINLFNLLKRSLIALPFALAAVTAIVSLPGESLADISIGPWEFTATYQGLLRFVSIVLRSWLSVQMGILLIRTTRFPDILHALRHLKVPHILISIIAFMYRYLFVISEEALRMLNARAARSAQLPGHKRGGSVFWRARVAGTMAGQLFLRSYERSDRVYDAMLARGYRGQLLTIHPHHMCASDWVLSAAGVAALAVIQAAGWLLR